MAKWRLVKDGIEIDTLCITVTVGDNYLYSIQFTQERINGQPIVACRPSQYKDRESDFNILLEDGSIIKAELIKEPDNIIEWFRAQNFNGFDFYGERDLFILRIGILHILHLPQEMDYEQQKRIILRFIDLYS